MNDLKHVFDRALKCAFFVVTVALAADALPAQQTTDPITVMSFNIRYGKANDGNNHWKKRRDLVRETIQAAKPDLLGLQEALAFQCEFLKDHLPIYELFGRGREAEANKGEFCAILFNTLRFTKTDGGHFWLSETPSEAGSKSWDSALPRMVTWVQLQDKQSGCEFIFANTHFDHRGTRARENSALTIRKWQESQQELPFVLTGDFNAAYNSKPYQNLIGVGDKAFTDTYRVIHPETNANEGTFGAWTGKTTGARIDWVLHNSLFKTLDARINYFNDSGRYPSDHFPVQATIRMTSETD